MSAKFKLSCPACLEILDILSCQILRNPAELCRHWGKPRRTLQALRFKLNSLDQTFVSWNRFSHLHCEKEERNSAVGKRWKTKSSWSAVRCADACSWPGWAFDACRLFNAQLGNWAAGCQAVSGCQLQVPKHYKATIWTIIMISVFCNHDEISTYTIMNQAWWLKRYWLDSLAVAFMPIIAVTATLKKDIFCILEKRHVLYRPEKRHFLYRPTVSPQFHENIEIHGSPQNLFGAQIGGPRCGLVTGANDSLCSHSCSWMHSSMLSNVH